MNVIVDPNYSVGLANKGRATIQLLRKEGEEGEVVREPVRDVGASVPERGRQTKDVVLLEGTQQEGEGLPPFFGRRS